MAIKTIKKSARVKIAAKGLAWVLCLSLLVPGTAGAVLAEGGASAEGQTAEKSGHSDLDFSEYVYKRPDTEAIDGMINEAIELAGQLDNEEKLLDLYRSIIEEEKEVTTQQSLAYIYRCLDLTDAYYEEESDFMETYYRSFDNALLKLTGVILDSEYGKAFQEEWGEDFVERYELNSKLNSDEIQPLIAEENKLIQQYQNAAADTYTAGDKGLTLEELDENDPDYELAYEEIVQKKNQACGEIYRELVQVRTEIAETLGYESYTEYAYDSWGYDYTPEEMLEFAGQIKEELLDVYKGMVNKYLDEEIYALPEKTLEEGMPYLEKALKAEFPDCMMEALDYMEEHGLYVFDSQTGMKDVSFSTIFETEQAPYMYVNSSSYNNAGTLFHEFGHYANFYIQPDVKWNDTKELCIAEIQSGGMEMLMLGHYPEIYTDNAEQMEYAALLDMLDGIMLACCEEEFEQEVYRNPEMSLEEMNNLYEELSTEYLGYNLKYEWVDIQTEAETPFYFNSYAVSGISGLELWSMAEEDREAALAAYYVVEGLGPNVRYRDGLDAAGLQNPFETDIIGDMAEKLETDLGF